MKRRLMRLAADAVGGLARKHRSALSALADASERVKSGFVAEPTALLRRTAADAGQPLTVRMVAAARLRDLERHRASRLVSKRPSLEFDVVIVSNYNLPGGTTASNISEIRLLADNGKSVGLVHHPLYDSRPGRPLNPKVLRMAEHPNVEFIGPESEVRCDLLLMRFPPFASRLREDMPSIEAKTKLLVVNQAPMAHYDETGSRDRVWDISTVHAGLLEWTGEHQWIAAGPLVRRALLEHHATELRGVDLADGYWYPIVDPADMRVRDDRPPTRPIRIGRHSRDHAAKWPETATTLMSCYPEGPEFEVHVLGGAEAPTRMLGGLPPNWTVHRFDALPSSRFLASLDFFVYFPDSTMLEAFGRAPAEAMASGVPVILPPDFEPVFGDGAAYTEPAGVRELVLELANDSRKYCEQRRRGLETARARFGHAAHRERLASVGVAL